MRWLHTARAVAQALQRQPTAEEVRGPFESYRWAVVIKPRRGRQQPQQVDPWYGVVDVRRIIRRVHMVRGLHDDGLFRLNTDIWLEHL